MYENGLQMRFESVVLITEKGFVYRPDETPVRSLFGFHLEIPRLPGFFF
jgi:hypothetical protein